MQTRVAQLLLLVFVAVGCYIAAQHLEPQSDVTLNPEARAVYEKLNAPFEFIAPPTTEAE